MKSNNIFEFRGECSADAQAIRAVLFPWLMDWREARSNLDFEGEKYAMADVSVVFSLTADGPSLNEMLWLIDAIDNCHIAAETLSRAEDFTGERQNRGTFEFPAQRPSDDILQRVNAAVKAHQHLLSLELNRYSHLGRTYNTACRLGDKWNPFRSNGSRPGWLVIAEHPPTGLKAIRKVSAPIGRENLEKLGNTVVDSRMSTIAA
jgi:hypothetical protein